MVTIPKKVSDRFIKNINKFQKVLKNASDRDVNEADTVTIVADILDEIFGFDKYSEITSEFAIRSTYCDLAVKIKDDIKYLIEVKAIGLTLKEQHLRQAVDYGANKGVQWVVLTNGLIWEIYNIRLEKSLQYDKVCTIDFLNINPRKLEDQEILFLLCKEGLSKAVIEEYQERIKILNRFVIGAVVLNSPTLELIRRELRRMTPGLRVDTSEIESILRNEVLKREVIEGEVAKEAHKMLKKSSAKLLKKKTVSSESDINEKTE
jgi:hypothetical protein